MYKLFKYSIGYRYVQTHKTYSYLQPTGHIRRVGCICTKIVRKYLYLRSYFNKQSLCMYGILFNFNTNCTFVVNNNAINTNRSLIKCWMKFPAYVFFSVNTSYISPPYSRSNKAVEFSWDFYVTSIRAVEKIFWSIKSLIVHLEWHIFVRLL